MSTPATPPAEPAAPATPAPTNTPSPVPAAPVAPAAEPKSEFDTAWDKLESRSAPKQKPAEPDKAPDPKAAEPKPGDEPAKPAPVAPAKDDPKAPKQLREQLEKRNKEYGDLETKHRELEKRITDAEAKGKDSTALTERQAALEKQLQEKDAELRALKQEASPEFKDKYDKPFKTAASNAMVEIEQLQVITQSPNGEPSSRPANWQKDFAPLYALGYAEAKQMAKTLFGEEAGLVMDHYNALKRLDRERSSAFEQEKAGWKEREEKQVAESAKQREFIEATWTKVNKDIAEKSEWFQPNPEDAEATTLLEEGYKLVDAKPATLQERIIHDAQIRNRAAAHPRMKYELTKSREKIKELEATIAEMKGSEPAGVQRPGGHTAPATEKDWKTELRESGAVTSV